MNGRHPRQAKRPRGEPAENVRMRQVRMHNVRPYRAQLPADACERRHARHAPRADRHRFNAGCAQPLCHRAAAAFVEVADGYGDARFPGDRGELRDEHLGAAASQRIDQDVDANRAIANGCVSHVDVPARVGARSGVPDEACSSGADAGTGCVTARLTVAVICRNVSGAKHARARTPPADPARIPASSGPTLRPGQASRIAPEPAMTPIEAAIAGCTARPRRPALMPSARDVTTVTMVRWTNAWTASAHATHARPLGATMIIPAISSGMFTPLIAISVACRRIDFSASPNGNASASNAATTASADITGPAACHAEENRTTTRGEASTASIAAIGTATSD